MSGYSCRTHLTAWLLTSLLVSCRTATPTAPPEGPTGSVISTATEPFMKTGVRIRATMALPIGAQSVAIGGGFVWITNPPERSVSRIDVSTGKLLTSPIILDFAPRQIAYGAGAVWVLSADHATLARIDPLTNEVIAQIDLSACQIPEHSLVLMAAGDGTLWITDQTAVLQIDPKTNQLVGEPLTTGEEIIAVALGHGTFWTGSHDDGMVARIDPVTHEVVAKIDMGFSVHGLAVDEASAWVLDEHGFAVVRIDPKTNQLQERIPIDFVGANLAAGAGSVWVAPAARDNGQATGNDGIARMDPNKQKVMETIHVGGGTESEYYAASFVDGSLWVLIVTPQMSVVQISP